MTRSRVYRDGRLEAENFDPGRLAANLADPDTIVWLDLDQPSQEDLAGIAGLLGLHELAVEDAVQAHERPKLTHYPGHGLIIAYAMDTKDSGELVSHELAIFFTKQTLVTVRKDGRFDMDGVVTRWDTQPRIEGISYLVHGVLDYIVDTYLDAILVLDNRIEELEDNLFEPQPSSTDAQRRSLLMHKSLGHLRRKVSPMREVITPLLRHDDFTYNPRMEPYYQDVLDHVLWAAEQVDSLRDLIATIRDTQLNLQGNRMNLIMKKVTSWAAIIAVPTAITGFYGQNIPVPGHDAVPGLIVSTVAIVLVSIALYATFKRKDWL